ncbi:MAG: type VI secretion system baseplate subunit TssG [Polaromonas sp.]|uniref:type VI secretion system baseplate subunit TssG n=1 Tax=Polaromonas sp. TaxID=1869339 RepID=UPI0025F6A658|nr:type VI secretion system baseplate subunit TssG [Polaromonas sp.]MBI2727142.1 type VI secretion system baseplate subunit TssG [Polaromonas sp.]
MAAEIGTAAAAVEESLLAHGERYSYFQAMRLLHLFAKARGLPVDSLRVRPKLGLGFPDNDIEGIEARPEGGYRVTANFFGLYGVASPLPTYYTEDLFEEEREGRHATRDFLDIVHHAMYPLLFDAWRKYRLQLRVLEDGDTQVLNRLYSFVGLDDAEVREQLPYSGDLLRYAGLFNLHPRSAMGLQTLLSDAFSPAKVRIECCTLRAMPIPADQRLHLGLQAHCLGEDTYLGSEIDDYSSSLSIHLDDLPEALFHQLLPGTGGNARLEFLTRFYLIDPLDIQVRLGLRHEDARAARTLAEAEVGNVADQDAKSAASWSRLGLDTWISPETGQLPTRVQYTL